MDSLCRIERSGERLDQLNCSATHRADLSRGLTILIEALVGEPTKSKKLRVSERSTWSILIRRSGLFRRFRTTRTSSCSHLQCDDMHQLATHLSVASRRMSTSSRAFARCCVSNDGEVESARAQLSSDGFDKAWNEGRAMTLDQAVRYASDGSIASPGSTA